jgi:putative membrane protein
MADQEKTEQPPRKVPEDRKATEYLANERTFLAWIRTSIAMVSLGFVVARFGLWLAQTATHVTNRPQPHGISASLPAGLALTGFGGLLAVLAAWRYHVVNRSIEQGEVKPDRGLVFLVTILMALLAVGMIIYLLVSVGYR